MSRNWLALMLVVFFAACKGSKGTPGTPGAAGSSGAAGTGSAGTGAAGSGSAGTGAAGTGSAGTGAAGAPVGAFNFQTPYTASFPGKITQMVVGDFDGDGKVDVAGAKEGTLIGTDPVGLWILHGLGDGTFGTAKPLSIGKAAVTSLAASDLNFDGVTDLIGTSANGGPFVLTRNSSGGFDTKIVNVDALAPTGVLGSVLPARLPNGNIVAILDDNRITQLVPDAVGNVTATPALELPTFEKGPLVAVGDFDGDGRAELFSADPGKTTVNVSVARPDGSFFPFAPVTLSGPARSLGVADLNGDGHDELVVAEGPAAGADKLEILEGGLAAPTKTTLVIPTTLVGGAYSFGGIGAASARGADLVFVTPAGLAFVGEGTPGEGFEVRSKIYRETDTNGVVTHIDTVDTDLDGVPDLIMSVDLPAGGSAVTVMGGVDTGRARPACRSLEAAAVDAKTVADTELVGEHLARVVARGEIFGALCARGAATPVGEKTPNSPDLQELAAVAAAIETFFRAAAAAFFSQSWIDADFNNSRLECGQGPNGYTLCPTPKNVMPAGDYVIVAMAQAGKIPVADATNYFQFAAVFDADGDPANNFVPLAAYPKDFFKGTDRWYEALYVPGMGWKLKVSTAHGMTITPVTDSFARIVLVDNMVFFVIPRSELPAAKLGYRVTAFRHKGDYGLKAPFDWDANVSPPVDAPLATHP